MYPPGYAPFLRKPLAPIDYDGTVIYSCDECPDWKNTFFKAVLDYAENKHWRVNEEKMCYQPHAKTQYRQIIRARELIIGNWNSQNPISLQEAVCSLFKIPLMTFMELFQKLQGSAPYAWKVLTSLLAMFVAQFLTDKSGSPNHIYEKLLVLGYHRGMWGKPYRLKNSRSLIPINSQGLPKPVPP